MYHEEMTNDHQHELAAEARYQADCATDLQTDWPDAQIEEHYALCTCGHPRSEHTGDCAICDCRGFSRYYRIEIKPVRMATTMQGNLFPEVA